MTKILNEKVDNKYTQALKAVEKCMDDNKFSICYMGGDLSWIKIHDREFKFRHPEFPRLTDDEHLCIED